MNGVSRFLSRRDKYHEKRQSKNSRSKVQPSSHISTSSSHPSWPLDDAASQDSLRRRRLSVNSLQSFYPRLQSILLPSSPGSFPFLRNKSFCADLTRQVPMNLSMVFSNDELEITVNDGEKKVREQNTATKELVKTLVQRLQGAGITTLGEAQAQYALSWYPDDMDKAYAALLLANDSFDGILKDYDPNIQMKGAMNRNMVTCYLDALLFAMFARLDSFEAMLFDNFNDEPRKKLAGVLRLWVNLLRNGHLIREEITKHLQDSLAKCGWEEAADICQQDASEAFTFITGALELPLLTLKMDIYHTGREDKEDDHKFVNERLLEVAIPEQDGDDVVTLEDCLEAYFNNMIEVKRYLQRQNTIDSIRKTEQDPEKNQSTHTHIETMELSEPSSPMVSTPTTIESMSTTPTPASPTRPVLEGRRRADSIFAERYSMHGKATDEGDFSEKKMLEEMLSSSSSGRPRASSLRKEVMMPAWQFFSLIPWYTDNVPKSDAQVAAHFSAKRPVLGICLKRYTMLPNGTPRRLGTYIDIPLEIGLPHFISDDRMKEEGPLFGNFKLVLQSVVCHRGVSVDSGHYVSLVRANVPPQEELPRSSKSQEDVQDSWLRFDDLANPRVSDVDIKKALKEESPYLLFYQVHPIDEELASRGDPPAYAETQFEFSTADPSRETLASMPADSETSADWDKVTAADLGPLDLGNSDEPPSRSSMSSNRQNCTAFEELESSVQSLSRGRTQPPTPDEQRSGFLITSRRNSRTWMSGSKSRPSSQSGENRLSLTLSRLTGRASKDRLQIAETGNPDDPVIIINEVESAENGGQNQSPVKEKLKDGGLGRSRNKRGKEKKEKNRPDRECVVM